MAHRRMAISSLLSDEPSTPAPNFGQPQTQPVPAPAPAPVLAPSPAHAFQRHGSPPIQLSLPPALTRRTPSPPSMEDAPPMKRHRSDPEPQHRRARPPHQSSHSVRQVSPSDSLHRPGSRASYSNPSFYMPGHLSSGSSPRSPVSSHRPRAALHSISTGEAESLSPLPLATFHETTNTEQRWAESRAGSLSGSGSGSRSPIAAKPEPRSVAIPSSTPAPTPNSAIAALSAGAKVVEDMRASLIEERSAAFHARRGSGDLTPAPTSRQYDAAVPLPRLGPSSPLAIHLREYTPMRPSGGSVGYPSSSERERARSPHRLTASVSPTAVVAPSHHVRSPLPLGHEASRPLPHAKAESTDAHDWLLETYASMSPDPLARRVQRGPGLLHVLPDDSDRDPVLNCQRELARPQSSPTVKGKARSPSPTVDDELLSLIDGPDSSSKHTKENIGEGRKEIEQSADKRQPAKPETVPHVEEPPTAPTAGPSHAPDALADGESAGPRPKAKPKRPRPSGGKKKIDGPSTIRQRKKPAASSVRSRSVSLAVPGSSRMSSPSVANGADVSTPGADDIEMDLDAPRSSVAPELETSPSKRQKMRRSNDDKKLYCICKMPYDESRVMIACDKCDEWYHTACVDLSEAELELIDQFHCPVCQSVNPTLKTSYKMRCFRGASSSRPSSPSTCTKAARLPLSKYCSDECGMAHVRARLSKYNGGGSKAEPLWHAVKASRKIEGVTTPALQFAQEFANAMDIDDQPPSSNGHAVPGKPAPHVNGHGHAQTAKQLEELQAMLASIATERDAVMRALDYVHARERLIDFAASRSERLGECGWDDRLLFSDGEWQRWIEREDADGGAWLLSSSDDSDSAGESGWWCTGKKKCERHNGWQKLRVTEVEAEKYLKNMLLEKLTAREREIRRCIEDLEPPVVRASAFGENALRAKVNGKALHVGGTK